MRVRYTARAFADREQIFEYLYQRSPDGAHNVLSSIRESVAQLSDQPQSYATEAPAVLRTGLLNPAPDPVTPPANESGR
jgi:plasmid stabilization system protein ParE